MLKDMRQTLEILKTRRRHENDPIRLQYLERDIRQLEEEVAWQERQKELTRRAKGDGI
jgi:hypothetical protein